MRKTELHDYRLHGNIRVGQKRINRDERKQNKGDKKITDSEGR